MLIICLVVLYMEEERALSGGLRGSEQGGGRGEGLWDKYGLQNSGVPWRRRCLCEIDTFGESGGRMSMGEFISASRAIFKAL